MKLTIAIPTYNRAEKLIKTIESLLPQLTQDCKLLIIDNCSNINIENRLLNIIPSSFHLDFKFIKNNFNIGGNSNILKCFELCETKWLWVLSDDDQIEKDAISTIFNEINNFPNAININFYSPHILHPKRYEEKVLIGKKEFLENIDSMGSSIFISTNIYNTEMFRNQSETFLNPYSCCPQWLIIYNSLNENSINIYTDKIICKNIFEPNQDEYSSVILYIINGFITILDMPNSKHDRLLLIKKILTIDKGWITYRSIIKCLLIEYIRSKKTIDIKYNLKKHYNCLYKYSTISNKLTYIFYNTLISISPTLAFHLTRILILYKSKQDINKYI